MLVMHLLATLLDKQLVSFLDMYFLWLLSHQSSAIIILDQNHLMLAWSHFPVSPFFFFSFSNFLGLFREQISCSIFYDQLSSLIIYLILCLGFLYFWGCTFIVVTTLVGIFKHESTDISPKEESMNIMNAYHVLWKTVQLPNMKIMAFLLLTAKVTE